MNVLFIAVDDLRPELGCYGKQQIVSPNIDSFAKEAIVFNNAYCSQASCTESRTAMLTGLRPDSTHVTTIARKFRDFVPSVVTLPELFKENGYKTLTIGKVFHHKDPQSWTYNYSRVNRPTGVKGYYDNFNIKLAEENNGYGLPFERIDVHDTIYNDGWMPGQVVDFLDDYNNREPFFFAVGFNKPHLPFTAPLKYWNYYEGKDFAKPVPNNLENGNEYSFSYWWELRKYYGLPDEGEVPEDMARILRHGYYASISYVDEQIGLIIDALKRNNLYDNTIIIIWGDHGYKIGEFGHWTKHSNAEIDTRIPLIMRVPNMSVESHLNNNMIESLDLYPTIATLAGLDYPKYLHGRSFNNIFSDKNYFWEKSAISQFRRNSKVMGYTIRNKHFRYVAWVEDREEIIQEELYDVEQDPLQSLNVIDYPSYNQVKFSLNSELFLSLNKANLIHQSVLNVYPNPNNGEFTVKVLHMDGTDEINISGFPHVNSSLKLYIYDVLGKLLVEKRVNLGIEVIDISQFNNKIYFVEVRDDLNISKGIARVIKR